MHCVQRDFVPVNDIFNRVNLLRHNFELPCLDLPLSLVLKFALRPFIFIQHLFVSSRVAGGLGHFGLAVEKFAMDNFVGLLLQRRGLGDLNLRDGRVLESLVYFDFYFFSVHRELKHLGLQFAQLFF